MIPDRKRYSLWKAHGNKCVYCTQPVRFNEMEADHIIPRSLLLDVKRLESIKRVYGLDADFNLNDYENWLPSHGRCNQIKGNSLLSESAARFFLEIARKKAVKARKEESICISNLKSDGLLASLKIALDEGLLSKTDVLNMMHIQQETQNEPIVITFGLKIETVLESGELPHGVSIYYPDLCDWLEDDLIQTLRRKYNHELFYPEPSTRDGEILSVRIAVADFQEELVTRFISPWWEILEVVTFSEIYEI